MRTGRRRRTVVHAGITAIAAIATLIAPSVASANTVLHVDAVHGHDTGNCQSTPCKTFTYAVGRGRMVPDLITIQAAPGTYTEDLALGAADSGLTIIGAASGTNPAKSTILRGVSGNPTINTTTAGDSASLSLANLRIVNPAGDTAPALAGSSTSLRLNNVPLVVTGGGLAVTDSDASVTLAKSPITLGGTSGTSPAIAGGSLSLTLSNSPIDVKNGGSGIANGNAPVTLTHSPITLENTSGSGFAIANGGGAITLSGSAIDVKGTGYAIANGGAPVTLTSSPILLENTSGTGFAIANSGGAVTLSSSAITVNGTGYAVAGGSAPVTLNKSPVTLRNATGSGFAIADGGGAVTLTSSAIRVYGTGYGIAGGSAPVTLSSSPITLLSGSGSPFAIADSGGSVTLGESPIVLKGNGGGILAGGAPVTVISSSITLGGTAGTTPAIANSGAAVTVRQSNIDVKGKQLAIANSGGTTALSRLRVTLDNSANPNPAVVITGRGSSLSHVTISGVWSGQAIVDTGSLTIADSTVSSGPSTGTPLIALSDGGTTGGRAISIQRSRLTEHSTTLPAIYGANVDMTTVSSAVLGGKPGLQFAVTGGVTRALTVVSSTIDAGQLGTRGTVNSVTASSDNTSGSLALVNVEGSILVERPAALRGGTSGASQVNCTHTEVPSTSQAATSSLGAILCASSTSGNSFTSSLGAIFASPSSRTYKLNPHWSGVDSVPASAISVPPPFSDSPTDLLGNPRVLNGRGTCLPGVRDKGAIELTGHGGIVPKPVIAGPSHGVKGATLSFTGKAPNLPASVHPTFRWHTSDGATGTGSHFSHRFTRTGKFKISLTATGRAACTATVSQRVTISAPKHSTRRGPQKTVQGALRRSSPDGRTVAHTRP